MRSRQWLLIIYALLISGAAMWLGKKWLSKGEAPRQEPITDIFGNNTNGDDREITAVTARKKNATITIRNSQTQQAEVSETVHTRRLFAKDDESTVSKPTTDRIERKAETRRAVVNPGTDSIHKPTTDRIEVRPDTRSVFKKEPTTDRTEARPDTRTIAKPPTVRVEQQQSDRQDAIDVPIKPRTVRIERQGFTLVEVMLSIAVLATVMTAVISSIYTLRMVQMVGREDARVHELTRSLAERIMGAQWDWLGIDRPDADGIAYQHGAWSWHRRMPVDGEVSPPEYPPMSETDSDPLNNLQQLKLLVDPAGVKELKVYLEYYRMGTLVDSMVPKGTVSPYELWQRSLAEVANRLPEKAMNLQLMTNESVVVRVVSTWISISGGIRRHELVFARRK